MAKKIKVLIVDDSMLIREMMKEILSSDGSMEVVGTAIDPYDAREKIKSLNPDVITLDVEMPKMDGISFLEKIMSLRPTPVVMVSTLTQRGADTTIRALEIGAIDYVAKPTSGDQIDLHSIKDEIIAKVKMASGVKVRATVHKEKQQSEVIKMPLNAVSRGRLIAIGASTGGVEALKEVLTALPKETPPIMIVQHMPPKFTKSFAERLDNICQINVHEATDKQKILPGNAYISPGLNHMRIEKDGISYICRVNEGEKVSGHCPSVDVLFDSVARVFGGANVTGVILTGMGKDGARGMLNMKKAGAFNIGQDESSCVVYGMPKEAKQNGAVNVEVPLDKIAEEIIKSLTR